MRYLQVFEKFSFERELVKRLRNKYPNLYKNAAARKTLEKNMPISIEKLKADVEKLRELIIKTGGTDKDFETLIKKAFTKF